MDETTNCLEILLNVIYLAQHSLDDRPALEAYLGEAERQASKLAVIYGRTTPALEQADAMLKGSRD